MKSIREIIVFSVLCFLVGCDPRNSVEISPGQGRVTQILNTEIYYEEYGEGPPLLLLSGGGIDRSIADFKPCIPELAKHFRVVAPDTPGQGRSAQPDSISYHILTSYMSQFIDDVVHDSVYVMGWSDGGIVAILLAEKRPDRVKKAIAVGANNGVGGAALPPGVPIDSVKPMSIAAWEKTNKKLINYYESLGPSRDWKKMMTDLNTMWYAKEYFSPSIYDRIHIPVMIVLGDRDDIAIEHGLAMHRAIAKSEFYVLPNTSHEVFAEQPLLISKIAIEFFER